MTLGGLESPRSDGVVLAPLLILLSLLDPDTTAVCTHAAKLANCSSILSIRTLNGKYYFCNNLFRYHGEINFC
jgi:hypothetical protein